MLVSACAETVHISPTTIDPTEITDFRIKLIEYLQKLKIFLDNHTHNTYADPSNTTISTTATISSINLNFNESIYRDKEKLEHLHTTLHNFSEASSSSSSSTNSAFHTELAFVGQHLRDIKIHLETFTAHDANDIVNDVEELICHHESLTNILKQSNSDNTLDRQVVRARKPCSILKRSSTFDGNGKSRLDSGRRVRFVSESENIIYHIPLVRKQNKTSLPVQFMRQLVPILVCIFIWYIAFYYILMWYLRYAAIIT